MKMDTARYIADGHAVIDIVDDASGQILALAGDTVDMDILAMFRAAIVTPETTYLID